MKLPTSAAAGIVLVGALVACSPDTPVQGVGGAGVRLDPAAPSDFELGELPDFELLDQRGRTVTKGDLLGRPLVMDAVFTTCAGPCPLMGEHMALLQDELQDTDVLLVSLSVDPVTDTVEVLADYAETLGADPERWLFLTGDEEAIYTLVREGLAMAVARAPEEDAIFGRQVTHDTKLLTVDREGLRRGWYDGTSFADLERAKNRARFLAGAGNDSQLPLLNASLNGAAFVLLVVGLLLIKAGRREAHARTMIAATLVSGAFLASYLTYHFVVIPEVGHTPFRGEGAAKIGYLLFLASHVILAAVNLPMILITLHRAWKEDWEAHRRWAKRTFPIWAYVSITGVLVYLILYRWNPPVGLD